MPIIYSFDPDDWGYPSQNFENETGARGVAHWYVMPEGETVLDTAKRMIPYLNEIEDKAEYMDAAQNCIAELEKYNPEMLDIDYDTNNGTQLAHVLLGVLSSFNVDDIQFFIDTTPKLNEPYDPVMGMLGRGQIYRLMLNKIYTNMHDVHGEWMLSPKTFDRLRDHFNIAADICVTDADVEQFYLQERAEKLAQIKDDYETSKKRFEDMQKSFVIITP